MDEPNRRAALLEQERRRQRYVRRGRERRLGNRNQRMIPSGPTITTDRRVANRQEALSVEKREVILKNLIHKKVLSKSMHLVLPHEHQLSMRQNNLSEKILSFSHNISGIDEEEEHEGKRHILVETLRSIRSTLNISIRTDHDSTTLYSPKTCPICCEDYIKGDDIAWSKNEECCHAFHTDCIEPWLMEHEECPMCRNDYICLHIYDEIDKEFSNTSIRIA